MADPSNDWEGEMCQLLHETDATQVATLANHQSAHTVNQMPEDLFTNMPTADVEEFFKLNHEGKQQQQQRQASEDTRVPQVQKKTKKSICRNIFGGLSFWIGLLYVFDFLLSIHLMHPNENAFKAATEEGWLPIGWFFYFWLVLIVCVILLYDFFC